MKNKGFTLVEILSIIAVLGVIVLIVLPNIGGNIEYKKEKELEKKINMIENSAKVYHSFNSDEYIIKVSSLISEKYLVSDMTHPKTGELLDGCVNVTLDEDDIFEYTYGSCESIEVPLNVELGIGSTTQQFEPTYLNSTKIELIDPTSDVATFKGWKVVSGNSILKGKTLIIGTTATELYALWEGFPSLEVQLDGGSGTDYNGVYKSGTIIELDVPTKLGYTFSHWEVVSGNSFVSGNKFTMGSTDTVIRAIWKVESPVLAYQCKNTSKGDSYVFTYTGDCTVIDDNNGNWRVKFLSSGKFTSAISMVIDAFLVGAGGGGRLRAGGGGGYTKTQQSIVIFANTPYDIVVGLGSSGGDGGATSAFNIVANGGKYGSKTGGAGGSGGGGRCDNEGCNGAAGGYDGENGGTKRSSYPGGFGQGTTTREFGERLGDYYAGGGGGGASGEGTGGSGGSGGGGDGWDDASDTVAQSGAKNTGGGGGGPDDSGPYTSGGSGIVVIRNSRSITEISNIPKFSYTGNYLVLDDGNGNWRVKFLSSGKFTPSVSMKIDAFLVGAGGGGRLRAGGGGGYTKTEKSLSLTANTPYDIVVGLGSSGADGGATSAFNIVANGGKYGSRTGGAGGSGGGGRCDNEECNGAAGGYGGGNGGTKRSDYPGGTGSGTTTREFGESLGDYYAGGGGGGASGGGTHGIGGSGGGGDGWDDQYDILPESGIPNTGGGGGGPDDSGSYTSGGSGVVVIRNNR